MVSSKSTIKIVDEIIRQLLQALATLSPAGQKLLILALTAGVAIGYGSSALVCYNQKKNYQDQLMELTEENEKISNLNNDLQEILQGLEEEITEIESLYETCQESSQDLQGQISILGNAIEERDDEISILHQGLSGSGDFLGLYIIHVNLDVESDRMNVLMGNSLPVNSIIASISLWNSTHRYTDRSENATGIILGSMVAPVNQTFTWSPEQAQAPDGFLNTDDSYIVTVISINGYSDNHIYQTVKMKIDVTNWGFNDDSLVIGVYNDALRLPFPRAALIGVRRGGTNQYYNVSMPATVGEPETLGGAHYAWNATASGAPEGFLKKDTRYFIRVTYNTPESWFNWDKDYSESSVKSPSRERDNGEQETPEPPEEP